MNIRDHLLLLRVQAGLTQKQVAERMGVTQSMVSKLEKMPDEKMPIGRLMQFAKACNARIRVRFTELGKNEGVRCSQV